MDCPFCALVASGEVMFDGGPVVAVRDAFPLSPGHTLVIPRRHEPDFFALTAEEAAAVGPLVATVRQWLIDEHHPDGFNLGVNIGAAAGQTVAHAHLHVIPRYAGDVADPRGGIRWIIPARAPYWA